MFVLIEFLMCVAVIVLVFILARRDFQASREKQYMKDRELWLKQTRRWAFEMVDGEQLQVVAAHNELPVTMFYRVRSVATLDNRQWYKSAAMHMPNDPLSDEEYLRMSTFPEQSVHQVKMTYNHAYRKQQQSQQQEHFAETV